MSVARMLKTTVIAQSELLESISGALQELGVLDIEQHYSELPTVGFDPHEHSAKQTMRELNKARYILHTLTKYHTNEQPMSMFVSEKIHVDKDWYQSIGWSEEYDRLHTYCEDAQEKLTEYVAHIANNETTIAQLEPWLNCPVPLVEWAPTRLTYFVAGLVTRDELNVLASSVEELSAVDLISFESESEQVGFHMRFHHSIAMQVQGLLAQVGASVIDFPPVKLTASEYLGQLAATNTSLQTLIDQVEDDLQKVENLRNNEIVALVQALESAADRLSVRQQIARTDSTVVITGWIKEEDRARVESALSALGAQLDVSFDEPSSGDEVPVILKNPKWLEPFELLTDLYGRPAYGEIDPTLAMAPFFTLFFAICIGDVGYGIMLIVAFMLIKAKLDVAPGVIKFSNMMIYGGLAAIPVGIAFGSYFALPIDSLPTALQNLQLIDPLNELTTFLGLMLVIGLIQIVVGILIAAYDAFRKGDVQGAIGSQLSTLMLLGCIGAYAATGAQYPIILFGALILTMLLQGSAVWKAFGTRKDPLWDRLVGIIWLASTGVWIASFAVASLSPYGLYAFLAMTVIGLATSKVARSAVIGTLGGAYEVYGMTGILNDALSYTRLAALGLSGSLVGMVFNILAELVWGPAGSLIEAGGMGIVWGGLIAVLAALIFCIGHVFNVGINLLGAFVHPMRLQFVEFFGKFYEGGGKPFAPFGFKQENLVFDGRPFPHSFEMGINTELDDQVLSSKKGGTS